MPQIEIQRLDEPDLPAVAEYVHRVVNQAPTSASDLPVSAGHTAADFLDIFRWRSVENPSRVAGLELGHCIRRENGAIAGINLLFPLQYVWGERRLLGLASHTFFADEDVRIQAFFLFRRFLALKGFDFYFANTCNQNSSRVWEKCGGRPAPESDKQWLLPLRMGPLAREVAIRRGWKQSAGLAKLAGNVASLFQRRVAAGELSVQPTDDLQYMADVADRWRNKSLLVPDRNLSYLRWQYRDGPKVQRKTVVRFQDAAGRDGWYAVHVGHAGVDQNLTIATIVDWAIPSSPFDFTSVVRAVAHQFAGAIDAVVFRARPDISSTLNMPRLRQRSYSAPQYYLIAANRDDSDKGWEKAWVTSQADAV